MPKQYPAGLFRQRVIAQLEAARKVADLAADLDVSSNTIYIWCRQHLIDTGQICRASSFESYSSEPRSGIEEQSCAVAPFERPLRGRREPANTAAQQL